MTPPKVTWHDNPPVRRFPKGTRTSMVGTRLTDAERARFDLLRGRYGETMTEYVRRLIVEDDARQREERRREREQHRAGPDEVPASASA